MKEHRTSGMMIGNNALDCSLQRKIEVRELNCNELSFSDEVGMRCS